jgi:hypothetical protein
VKELWRAIEVRELLPGDLIAVRFFGGVPRVDLYHIISADEGDGGVTRKLRYFVTLGNGGVRLEYTEEDKWCEFTRRGLLFRGSVEITRELSDSPA